MTPPRLIRKALAVAVLASLSACGAVESDPDRFETLARRVADIRLSPEPSQDAPVVAGERAAERDERPGLRPALRVEVMDPHALWEARDGRLLETGLRGMMDAAAPVAVEAVTGQVTRVVAENLRPALTTEPAPSRTGGVTVQLGAYSSEASAREAWDRFGQGPAAALLTGLSPVFEPVEANGRRLVRLKVTSVAADAAAHICHAARIDDPWCQAAGRA